MKRLSTTAITTGVAMPLKSGLLDFLQDAHKETTAYLVDNLLGFTPDADTVYILSGLVNSNTAPTYNVSAGVVFYNGEIYEVPAFSFTTTGSNLPYPNLVITQYTTNADPVEFTDGTPRNVCDIRKLVVTSTAISSGYPIFDNWYRGGAWIYGDTKEIVCNSSYVSTHFDSTGLGRKERKGWAIMNGNNGTPNDNGLVVVAYGTDYTTFGATGGEKTHVLTNGELPTDVKKMNFGGNVQGHGSDTPTIDAPSASTLGLGQAHNNMQPYVIRLRIMKING